MRRGTNQILAVLWLLVLLSAVVFQIGTILIRQTSQQPTRAADWLALIPLGILIYKHLVGHYEMLALLAEKTKLCVLNSTTEWSLEVRLTLGESDDAPDVIANELESVIRKKYEAGLLTDRRTATEFNFRLPRQFSANVSVEDGDSSAIVVTILDMHVSYRDSVNRIEQHLCPLFQHIENHFHVKPDGRKYSLIAYFPDGNPYFGVFIQKLKVEHVAALSLTIKTDKPGSLLSVKQDRVELVARSLDSFRTEFVNTFRLEMGAR